MDYTFFINMSWLQICVCGVNFVCKLNRLIFIREYYKREGEGGVPVRIAIWNCWNENVGGQKCTRSFASQNEFVVFNLWGRDPKATRYYETNAQGHKQWMHVIVCVFPMIPWPLVNSHINRGDFLLKIRGGPWGGPWTGPMDWVHGVVHGPGPSDGPWTPVHVLYTSVICHEVSSPSHFVFFLVTEFFFMATILQL